MRLTYHEEAEAEVVEAAKFYESRVRGLGKRFLSDFDAAISTILASPNRWTILEDDVRRFSMRRFPYAIYFRATEEEVRVLVVKHHKRHPDYWRHRLDS
jgi:toxin ParE1/3/4